MSGLRPAATSPGEGGRRDAGRVEIVLVLVVVAVLAVVQVRRRGSRLQAAEELRRSESLPRKGAPPAE